MNPPVIYRDINRSPDLVISKTTVSLTHTHKHTLAPWMETGTLASMPELPHNRPLTPSTCQCRIFQVIIVGLCHFIICADWITTGGKGQEPLTLTRLARNIFSRHVLALLLLQTWLNANVFVWGGQKHNASSCSRLSPQNPSKMKYRCNCTQFAFLFFLYTHIYMHRCDHSDTHTKINGIKSLHMGSFSCN